MRANILLSTTGGCASAEVRIPAGQAAVVGLFGEGNKRMPTDAVAWVLQTEGGYWPGDNPMTIAALTYEQPVVQILPIMVDRTIVARKSESSGPYGAWVET